MLTTADVLHITLLATIDILAMVTNAIYIGIILAKTPKSMHSYSLILFNIACVDFLASFCSFMCITNHSVILLMLSFAYRLWILTKGTHHEQSRLWTASLILILAFILLNAVLMFFGGSYKMPGLPSDLTFSVIYLLGGSNEIFLEGYSVFALLFTNSIGFVLIFSIRRRLFLRINRLNASSDRYNHQQIFRSLTAQMLLPLAYVLASILWFLDFTCIIHLNVAQRSIFILCSLFALGSPLINIFFIPPYRKISSVVYSLREQLSLAVGHNQVRLVYHYEKLDREFSPIPNECGDLVHMTFPLLIHSNVTEALPSWAFRALVGIEIVADIITVFFMILLSIAIWKANVVHPTFRIANLSIAYHYLISMITRLIIIHYQMNNIPIHKEDSLILACDIIRDHFLGYYISQLAAVSFERAVATRYWRWYERRGSGTLFVFLCVETIAVVPSLLNVILCEYDVYSHVTNFLICCTIVAFGLLLYSLVFCHNLSLLRRLHDFNDGYSISEAFQIKENLAVLKVMFFFVCTTAPIVIVSLLLFALYFFAPSFIHLALPHCIILIDVSVAVFAPVFMVIVAHGMTEYRRQLYKIRIVKCVVRFFGVNVLSNAAVGDVCHERATSLYFGQLAETWS